MKQHELKTHPKFFLDIVNGIKPFEFRRDDRGFEVGDMLILREWEPETEEYTGFVKEVFITYILRHSEFSDVPDGFCIMGIRENMDLHAKVDEFKSELSELINRYSLENGSNTPDFILAEHVWDSIRAFNATSRAREHWFGKELKVL